MTNSINAHLRLRIPPHTTRILTLIRVNRILQTISEFKIPNYIYYKLFSVVNIKEIYIIKNQPR